MKYEEIRQNQAQCKALMGLSVEDFDRLMESFAPAYETFRQKYTFDGQKCARRYSPRGACLTEAQKQENCILSVERVEVEHAVAGIKTCRIAKNIIYRNYNQDRRHEAFIISSLALCVTSGSRLENYNS